MSNIKIIFLGTSASTPTKERNLTSVLINYNGFNYLFDCPEGVQQQILKSKQSLLKIKSIFITHLHGDHYYGLFGLLSTMGLNSRTEPLDLFLPSGYKKKIVDLFNIIKLDINFEINIKEVKSNFNYDVGNVIVNSVKLDHSITTYGYIFKIKDKIGKFNKAKALKLGVPQGPLFAKLQNGISIKVAGKTIIPKQVMDFKYKKKGKSIAYLLDGSYKGKMCQNLKKINYLIHDSSFTSEHKLKAEIVKHPIAKDVAKFAKKYNCENLYLVHISSRYKDTDIHLKESRAIFAKSFVPKDLDVIETSDY
jgi:ribonuclease Z